MINWLRQIITDKQGWVRLAKLGIDGALGLLLLVGVVWIAFRVAELESASSYSQVFQTTHNGTGDTPDVGGFNNSTKTNTTVSGTGAAASVLLNLSTSTTTSTFNYTGAVQTWTVPTGVNSIDVDVVGAGGTSTSKAAGAGGRVQATLSVTPGSVLNIYVSSAAGYGGTGSTGGAGGSGGGGAGGGASDIRIGGTAVSNRVIVAAGAGGAASNFINTYGDGRGGAGGLDGVVGYVGYGTGSPAGGGGGGSTTSSTYGSAGAATGAGASYGSYPGTAGSSSGGGAGGAGYSGGGGGGGGYYSGGGGGGSDSNAGGYGGGGGGGSSCAGSTGTNSCNSSTPGINATGTCSGAPCYTSGFRAAGSNGYVSITYPLYYPSGTYESATVNLGGTAQLGNLSWSETIPSALGDRDYDLLIGASDGVCYAYENTGTVTSPTWAAKSAWNTPDVGTRGAPAFGDLDSDGDLDLLIGASDGIAYGYENTGSVLSPTWTAKSAWNTPSVSSYAAPTLVDLDNDGDYDILMGQGSADYLVFAFKNIGNRATPSWTRQSSWDLPTSSSGGNGCYTKVAVADLDNDGDYDVLRGDDYNNSTQAYENTGSATSPTWTAKSAWNKSYIGSRPAPALVDLDNDGDYDLMIGLEDGVCYAYENTGTVTSPTWAAKSAWNTPDVGSYARPAFVNLDSARNALKLQLATKAADSGWTITDYSGSYGAAPVGYWNLDQSSTTATDLSGYGNNGTMNGSSYWSTTGGKFGGAFLGNGSSNYISVPTSSILKPTSALTVEAWVKPTSFAAINSIVKAPNSNGWDNGWRMILLSESGNLSTVVYTSARYGAGASGVQLNQWNHVVLVYDGSTCVAYVNGQPGTPVAATGSITYPDASFTDLWIGQTVGAPCFSGLIDEVKIYPRALSQSEITQHYLQHPNQVDYFTVSNTALPSALSGKQYLRYKAFLSTSNTAYTPSLNDLTITIVPDPVSGVSIATTPPAQTTHRLTFTDANGGESGFWVWRTDDGSWGAGHNWSWTVSPGSGVITVDDDGDGGASLSANTQYWYKVAAYNANGTSSYTTASNHPRYTLIQTPSGITFNTVATDSITISGTGTFTNLTSGSSGIYFSESVTSTNSGWITTNSWSKSSLTANKQYSFSVKTRNGDGVENSTVGPTTKYTLAVAPSVTASPAASSTVAYPSGTTWTFTNAAGAGFGEGGVAYYRYNWTTAATYTFTGSETQWSSSTLTQTPSTIGSYYLHVKAYNGENVAAASGSTATYGPFKYDNSTPSISEFKIGGNAGIASTEWTYVNKTDDNGIAKAYGIFNDTPAGGTLYVQFSENGTNWGCYPGSGTTNNITTDWTNYKTIAASASAQEISNAWKWSTDGTADGSKILYVRVKDAAGNVRSIITTALGNYYYKKEITFNTTASGANVATAQTNFPICVHINSNSWTVASERNNFFGAYNTGGKRIRFYDADETTVLSYEVEYYDATSQEAIYWVRVPQVDGNSSTDKIVVVYGNDPNGSNQDNATTVWDSNFKGVWHLGNGATLSATDSTSNANNGTISGATATAGQVDGGGSFNGTSNYISTPLTNITQTNGITVSAFFNAYDTTDRVIVGKWLSGNKSFVLRTNIWGLEFFVSPGGDDNGTSVKKSCSTGVWTHGAGVFDNLNNNIYAYVNGASSNASYTSDMGGTDSVSIGRENFVGAEYYFKSGIDEVRISDTARSADWLKLEYYSMKKTNWNGDSWLTVGSQVDNRISDSITLDTAAPAAFELSSPASLSWTSAASPIFVWTTSSDGGSGMHSTAPYKLYIDGSFNKNSTTWTATPASALSWGPHTWYVVAQDNATNTTQSTSTWTINPVKLTSPNGGETWEEGSEHHLITWSGSAGLSDTVKIEYTTSTVWSTCQSPTAGVEWSAVAITDGDSGKLWKIPANITDGSTNLTNCQIRIVSNTLSGISETSDATWTIKPYRITLTAPATGTNFVISRNYPTGITWTTVGVAADASFLLDYSKTGGSAPWKDMNGTANQATTVSYAGAGVNHVERSGTYPNFSWSYSWTVPNDLTSALKVRLRQQLSEGANSTTWSALSGLCSIVAQQVHVTVPGADSPNNTTNNRWVIGDNETIYWSTEGLASEYWSIECHYYYPPENPVEVTKTIFANQLISYDSYDGTYYHYSQVWTVGRESSGATWNVGSDNAWIKIMDSQNSGIFGQSTQFFKIIATAPTISIVSPATDGSTAWYVNSANNAIQWDMGSPIGDVNNKTVTIQYATTPYSSWTNITTTATNEESNRLTYNWTIAANAPVSDSVKIKITDNGRAATTATSWTFRLLEPSITITSPTTADSWIAGAQHTITWNSTDGVGGADNKLSITWTSTNNATGGTVSATATDNGSYVWTVVDTVQDATENSVTTDTCYLKITDNSRSATTKGVQFTITEPTMTITSPTLNEEWIAGAPHTISWTSTNGLSSSMTVQWSSIAPYNSWSVISSTATHNTSTNTGSANWTVYNINPSASGEVAKIKIYDNNRNYTLFTKQFKIVRPQIYLVSPAGGETWRIGSQQNIQWTTTQGVSSSVKIEYYNNMTDAWAVAASDSWTVTNTAGGTLNTYAWTIPDIGGVGQELNAAKIRITDNQASSASHYQAQATQSTTFTIARPSVTVTAPTSGVTWRRGQTKTVTWTSEGSASNLQVSYAWDGTNWSILSGDFSGNSFIWTIATNATLATPSVSGANAKIKVEETTTPFGTGQTAWTFILDKQQLTYDNSSISGATWTLGTGGHTLQWTTEGQITTVRIQYRPNDSASWTTINETTNNNTSSTGNYTSYLKTYSWTIPNDDTLLANGTAQIKIISLVPNDPLISSTSSTTFTIAAPTITNVTITSPAADSGYYIGDTATISWTWVGKLKGQDSGAYKTGIYWTVSASPISNLATVTTWSTVSDQITSANWTTGWTIPSAAQGSYVYLKVRDEGRPTLTYGYSSAFAVSAQPTITITSPTVTPNWRVGKGYTISWSSIAGIHNNVLVECSLNDGATSWTTIASSQNASNTSGITWTVLEAVLPDADSASRQIRISDATRAGSASLADSIWTAAFTAVRPVITVSVPGTGAYWTVDTTPQITFAVDGGKTSGTADIYYDTDHGAGTTWSLIGNDVSYTPNASTSWTWTVPNDIGATGIKVEETSRPNYTWTTSGNFNIIGGMTLSTPSDSGIGLVATDTYNVTWAPAGTFTPVRLQFYDGSNWYDMTHTTLNGYTEVANTSPYTYAWSVPNTPTCQAKVKIYDPSYDTRVIDESDNPFCIGGTPYLTITSPAQGATVSWTVGTGAHTIQWTGSDNVNNNIAVYYSTNSGSTWWTINEGQTYNHNWSIAWTVPQAALASSASSGTVQIRVQDQRRTQTAMTWTPSVTILTPGISVGDPSAGTGYVVVSEGKAVSWTTDGEVSTADIYCDTNHGAGTTWSLVGNDISNTSNGSTSWTWTVPNDVGATSIKVEDTSRTNTTSGTSSAFTICGKFTAVSRSASEVTAGQALTISWSTTGQIDQGNIQLLYYRNDVGFDSVTYPSQTISSSDLSSWNIGASSGSVVWTVPTNVDGNYVNQNLNIRVRDSRVPTNSTSYKDTSSTFRIGGEFSVSSPATGNSWTVGTNRAIQYYVTGNVSSVNLKYTYDGSNWWTLDNGAGVSVTANTTNSFNWTVPDHISSAARIKVEDAANTSASALSGIFNIKGTLDLTAPDGGESWIIGTAHSITWSTLAGTSSISNVKLQYSTNGGTSWKDMSGVAGQATTVATSGASGSYTWTILSTEADSTQGRVRIYEENGLSNTDMSSQNFKIASPTVTVIQPGLAQRGSSSLVVNEPYDIKWTTVGSVNSIKIEVSYNNQGSWTIAGADAWTVGNTTPYSYTWTPTSAITAGAWVKITDLSTTHTGNVGYSDDAFSILSTPALALQDPTETWIAGKNYAIQWTATSKEVMGNVTLHYSLDGSTWWTIDTGQPITTSGTTTTGSYSWTLSAFYNPAIEPVLSSDNTTSKIKITDATRGVTDTTSNFTIGIPRVTVSQPNGSEYWAVGDTAQIKWTYQGSVIGPLTIQCDKTAATEFGPDIIWSVSNINKTGGTSGDGTYAYTWTIPSSPDVTGTAVKFKVIDSQRTNSSDTSDAVFTILSAPSGTMTAPTSSSHFYADETWTISWTIHGLIGKDASGNNNLIIQYSDDNFVSNIWSVASSVSRGTTQISGESDSGDYVGSYAWAIPSTAHTSNTMKIRVFDPARSIYWTSDAFPLTGGFKFRDPADSSVNWTLDVSNNSDVTQIYWTAGTGRTIYWYNQGSHDTVKLQYLISTDGTTWTTANYTNIAASIDNSPTGTVYNSSTSISTYSWTVADPAASGYPSATDPNTGTGYYYAKLKLIDGSDSNIYKESPIFKITYYQIKFVITNEYNYIVSSVMNFRDTVWSIANATSTVESTGTTYQHKYPYGAYTTLLSGGSGTDYGSFQVSWTADSSKPVEKKIYSNTYLQTDWETKANFFYNEDSDSFKINSWLERKRSPISQDADLGVGGNAYIKVYSSSDPEITLWTLTDSTTDVNGNYWFDWTSTGLTAGVSYFAKCGIYYSGDLHENTVPFSVSVSKKLSELSTQIDTKTSAIQTKADATWTLASTIAGQTATIETTVGGVQTKVSTIDTTTAAIKTDTGRVLTAAETTIPTKIETERATVVSEITSGVEPHVESGILNRDTLVKQGDTVTIRYRTTSGLSPTITVYDPNNVQRVVSAVMTEVGTSGVYEYDLKFATSWPKGDYTIVTSESTQGTVDALTMSASTADIEEVSSQVSTVLGSVTPVKDIKDKVDAFSTALNIIEDNITKASEALAGVEVGTEDAEEVAGKLTSLFNSIKQVSEAISSLGGTLEYDLGRLYEVSESRAKDIDYLRNKTQELKAMLLLNQKLLETAAKEEPVVQTWFEYR